VRLLVQGKRRYSSPPQGLAGAQNSWRIARPTFLALLAQLRDGFRHTQGHQKNRDLVMDQADDRSFHVTFACTEPNGDSDESDVSTFDLNRQVRLDCKKALCVLDYSTGLFQADPAHRMESWIAGRFRQPARRNEVRPERINQPLDAPEVQLVKMWKVILSEASLNANRFLKICSFFSEPVTIVRTMAVPERRTFHALPQTLATFD
jgi:hypothetical protein